MRYSAEIEEKIVAQINATPDLEVILPSWAYHAGSDQPIVYQNRIPVRLSRVLYERLVGRIPEGMGIALNHGVDRRNVNPHLFTLVSKPGVRLTCPNGHEYTEEDKSTGGHRCKRCRRAKNLGIPSPTQINAAKTHCPQGHPLAGDNLLLLKSGRRRCRTCHAAAQARYRARKAQQ